MKLKSFLLIALLPALAQAQISNSEYAARRTALAQRVQNGIVVALGSPEPEAALVMVVKNGAISGTPMLFVQASDPAREVWTGHRLGVAGVQGAFGLEGRNAETLTAVVDTLLTRDPGAALYKIGNFNSDGPIITRDDQLVSGFVKGRASTNVKDATGDVAALRRVKTPAELDLIRRAVNVTVTAQKDAMRVIEPGMNEFEVQALIEYNFRKNGADRPSFSTIVGSGPNSTTLHYGVDDRYIENNDVIVMDIGASYRGYAADVTRTVPSNGKFSPAQRDIYLAVRAAQKAAEQAAKVNGPARALSDAANASLDESLAKLGLIEAAGATYDCDAAATRQCSQRGLYYMHGLGHGIGLDVHDPGAATGGTVPLVPGSAFTIEPGIYVRSNLLEIIPNTPKNLGVIAKIRPAVQKYANIGVRIEDDYIVTPTEVEWISRAPRELEEVEAAMREKYTGPSPRDPATVEAYRSTGRRVP
jgi:Xaa-Pro aminopeptidase